MILVTGTKRSGTSMWMQILTAAGLPHFGQPFPADWGKSIRGANPKGFYESVLRHGVYFATNPHPTSGHYFRPEQVREHLVKVFIPGVVRTELGFLDHVVVSLRPWREYAGSIRRLYAIEDEHLLASGGQKAVDNAVEKRSGLPPEVEWWLENYELLRDMLIRRYPVHVVSYPRLLANPEGEVARVLKWLGREEALEAAAAVVDTGLRTQRHDAYTSEVLSAAQQATMDEYFDRMHDQRGLDAGFLARANTLQDELEAAFRPS